MKNQTDIFVRPAQREDMPRLHAILLDTFESTWRPNITQSAAHAFLQDKRPEVYVRERGLLFWVAEVAGEIAGFVDWVDDFVHALHVHSAYARQGIGQQLMDHAEAQIARAGFASARLETDTFNHSSRAFYAARGYHEAGRYPDEEWHSGLTTILLIKPLS